MGKKLCLLTSEISESRWRREQCCQETKMVRVERVAWIEDADFMGYGGDAARRETNFVRL